MNVIGWRKMVVIIVCAICITCIVCIKVNLDQSDVVCASLIAGLGGWHSWKQGNADEKKP